MYNARRFLSNLLPFELALQLFLGVKKTLTKAPKVKMFVSFYRLSPIRVFRTFGGGRRLISGKAPRVMVFLLHRISSIRVLLFSSRKKIQRKRPVCIIRTGIILAHFQLCRLALSRFQRS